MYYVVAKKSFYMYMYVHGTQHALTSFQDSNFLVARRKVTGPGK